MPQRIPTPPRHQLRVSGHWLPSDPDFCRWSVLDLSYARNGVPTGSVLLTDTTPLGRAPLDAEGAVEALESLLARWRIV